MAVINVLVFPCGSEIGLEIHTALKHNKAIRLHGVSSVADHGEYVYARYREIAAKVDSKDFIEQLNGLIDEWQIDIVLPAHDSVVLELAERRSEVRARVAVPDAQVARVCRNKNATYAFFAGDAFIPQTVGEDIDAYPIFAKPAVGQGSQGAEIVHDAGRHQQLLACGVEYVFSEYLPGAEYTVDCISDHAGVLLNAFARERMRVKSGISVSTQLVPLDEAIGVIAGRISEALCLQGAWFFQIKKDVQGRYKLMEIAPRIAGSMALSRNLGVNYPLLTIYAYLGLAFSVMGQHFPIRLDRALGNRFRVEHVYDTVYLDLDDTLIVGGCVHPTIAALLYQWLSRDIDIVLVTRHNRCPRETLKRYRIAHEVFSRIIHISDGSPKSAVIERGRPALFIDDSYRERLDVSLNLGIPVFDIDAVEQLLDWRC